MQRLDMKPVVACRTVLLLAAAAACGAAGQWLSEGASNASARPAYCSAPLDGPEGRSLDAARAGMQLVQVQVLTRHGARSAYHSLPGTVQTHSFECRLPASLKGMVATWPERFQVRDAGTGQPLPSMQKTLLEPTTLADGSSCPLGALLPKGFEQLLTLGRHLRHSYLDALHKLTSREVFAQSDPLPRTAQSAAALLTGFLGSLDEPLDLKIATSRPGEPEALRGGVCAKANLLVADADAAYKPPRRALNGLGSLLNVSASQLPRLLDPIDPPAADVTYSAVCDGGALPCGHTSCMSPDLEIELESSYNRHWRQRYDSHTHGKEASRLTSWPLLNAIVSRMINMRDQKVAVYASRDMTIAPVASALGFFDGKWPPFASHIVFELWASANSSAVRVVYDGKEVEVAGCGTGPLCPLERFASLVRGLLGAFASYKNACTVEIYA